MLGSNLAFKGRARDSSLGHYVLASKRGSHERSVLKLGPLLADGLYVL